MKKINTKSSLQIYAAGIVFALAAGAASADKPSWAGNGNGKNKEKNEHTQQSHHDDRNNTEITFSFHSNDQRIVSDYYGSQSNKAKCPPGLAKKNNGCLPPGQAKKWRKGQALSKDIQYYDLPRDLRLRLPAPPANHRYVQVAGDILMIAIGTSMVVDAIEDIVR
ncbi:RcnB family protein [Undibacterium piscinae]|uniref:RcnB family protein n=1 Tax=Undibacterium piscinae TaxID=2495591 RepID=A0A6M4A9H7_9BURK|nr:RcnB family protein [Undibacterium piscinae]